MKRRINRTVPFFTVILADMLKECNTSWTPMLQKPTCFMAAGMYYTAVYVGGKKAYDNAQKESCCKNRQ